MSSTDDAARGSKRSAIRWRLATGDDVEDALRAAERLLELAESRRQHADNRLFGIAGSILTLTISAGASLYIVAQTTIYSVSPVLVAVGLAFSALPSLMVLWYWVLRYRQHVRGMSADNPFRLAAELAALITEVYLDVAEREGWSTFRLSAFELRLSSFPLPEQLAGDANA